MPPLRDLTGQRFTRLVVLARGGTQGGQATWRCQCDCGKEVVVAMGTLVGKHKTKSCGCYHRETSRALGQSNRRHGQSSTRTGTYNSWLAMKSRCYKKSDIAYARYGGRGISVCKAWRESFESFLNDMGERPPLLTLDRIDNRFGYFLSNCRWATRSEQIINQGKRRKRAA